MKYPDVPDDPFARDHLVSGSSDSVRSIKPMRIFSQQFLLATIIISVTFSGCGGDDEQTSSETNSSAAPVQESVTAPQSTPKEGAQAASTPKVDPERKETKWIGKIPYDVFYDQPLTIAADDTVLGGTQPTSTGGGPTTPPKEMTPTKVTPTETGTASSGAGVVNWTETLPMPVLLEELKGIRTSLTGKLQTVATYNKSADTIGLDGAMIAALGAIVTVHPDAETWKDRGKFIRDLGYEIYSSAGESGRAAFMSTEDPFLKLQTAMDGGAVDGLEAEDVVPFSDVIYVADMMQRIEITMSNLKANINTKARMKEDPDAVERELRMLAAFASLMGTESYDNADAKPYQDYLALFLSGAKSSIEAVQAEDYEGFRKGLDQIQTTCAECHQQYKGNDDGF